MAPRRFALALTALVCANAYLLHPLGGTALPSRTSQLSRAAVVLKKGRAQGGTPKISLRRKKIYTARSKTDGLKQVSQRPNPNPKPKPNPKPNPNPNQGTPRKCIYMYVHNLKI